MKCKLLLAAIAVLSVPIAPAQPAQNSEKIGAIVGTVRDSRGKGVPGARVLYFDDRPLGGRIPEVRSDVRGRFEIHSLDWDRYWLSACKEEIDVPCGLGYNDAHLTQVTLSPQAPSIAVTVPLGRQAGVINGKVRDAFSHKTINAIFKLKPSQFPDKIVMETSAPPTFHIFVPASTDYDLEISAPGYKIWTYADHNGSSMKLNLRPGSHRHLDVNLEPLQ